MPEQPLLFAKADFRGAHHGRPFGILPNDLLRHVWVLGPSGSGKTVLLENLAAELIRRGHGVGVIDPHGDLIERLLDLVPRHRTNDVILFDPTDREFPVGLNVLEAVPPDARSLAASGVVSAFKKVYADSWGPRIEHLLRNSVLALLEVRGATLVHVARLLVDERFRVSVARQVKDPIVRMFWTDEFPSYPPAFRIEVVAPLQNKLALLTSPITRNIVGQTRSAFSCREVMDEGRVLLVRLPKGILGEDYAALLGALLVAQLQTAAYGRADLPPERRQPFVLVLDEFASFVSMSFGELLSEARKYGLGLVLAHQHLTQLDSTLRAAMQNNAGTRIVFRLGATDAEALAADFAPELTAHELSRLASHQIALRLAVDGVTSVPFTGVALPPAAESAWVGHSGVIRQGSRERYGRPRGLVERAVGHQLDRSGGAD